MGAGSQRWWSPDPAIEFREWIANQEVRLARSIVKASRRELKEVRRAAHALAELIRELRQS